MIYQKNVLMICPVGNQGAVERDKRREWWKGTEDVMNEPGHKAILRLGFHFLWVQGVGVGFVRQCKRQ